ncbi:MAG: aminotransferase class I/II-fold pyridoxal phosphate-dependent enzyme, partial [bacterium]|nr:aminotransferase class I/II-fold pyridoxal phosphate-dependent enzyme [bacterium]
MNKYRGPILISLSPNAQKDDLLLAFKLLFKSPKNTCLELEKKFKEYLGIKHAFTFNRCRTAFLAILKSLNIEKGDVLLQAFTCNAVVNPIIKIGLKPVFVDIDEETLNIDIFDLEKKISDQSKIVLIQHTFGLPANMDKIMEICQKHNLILIEDCAHSLGAAYKEKKLGTFGTAAFFSFGRDKVISSVFGGLAATNNEELARKIG